MRIASAVVHRGEEPPLVTGMGSGAVFFSGCTLRCSFCQNMQISSGRMGTEVKPGCLAAVCEALRDAGAANINLVTGSQFIPGITAELAGFREKNPELPVVWNSSGYESEEGMEMIAPLVDVYLLDLKALSTDGAIKLLGRPDYPEAATRTALIAAEDHPPVFRGSALVGGTILRHLVMPGMEAEAEKVIEWFGKHLAGRALFSLMVQYIDPVHKEARKPRKKLLEHLIDRLDRAGIEEGFIQESGDETDWFPDFGRINPFPEGYADPVWHWKSGFIRRPKIILYKDTML